jgi:hypothetical protein
MVTLNVLALVEELAGAARLGLEVVDVDVGPVLDLFEVNLVLLLLGLARLLLLLVAKAPVVHDLAHDRPRVRGHLDEVEALLACALERLVDRDNPNLVAFVVDESNRRESNPFIDAHLGRIRVVTKRVLPNDQPPLVPGF